MITAQIESFTASLPEFKPLFPLHWEELALEKDKVPLDPQYNIYEFKESMDELLFVTLREDGKPIGYFIGFIAPGSALQDMFDMHYGHILAAPREARQ
jgi:hypothetical protein